MPHGPSLFGIIYIRSRLVCQFGFYGRLHTPKTDGIEWKEWSKRAFEEAAAKKKLVLLDLSAVWCHWCHVMDQSTYSNPEVVKVVNDSFVPVRVDVDKRPDISERYNRGGFPTTAFLSDQGESVWGSTYISPADMLRIMNAVLAAKASGEIDSALERSRMQYLDISKALEKKTVPDPEFVSTLFEDVFASYDSEHGGFGIEPKFPHPGVIDLMLFRLWKERDEDVARALRNTLDRMLKGLYDPIEGGVYRYSVKRDWSEPHYEKMLETNVGILGNLARASVELDSRGYREKAEGIASYILKTLRDPETGGFYGSQDADEQYYSLPAQRRAKRDPPAVDRTIYAGWNSAAAATLVDAGALLGLNDWISAGLAAWAYSTAQLWDEGRKLVRHLRGQDLFLFEDQVMFLESLLAVKEVRDEERLAAIARDLLDGVDKWFLDPEGGYDDVSKGGEDIGDLSLPRRPIASNARYARAMARLGIAIQDLDLIQKARNILLSFTSKDVEAYGLFASDFIISWWAMEAEPVLVEVHNAPEDDPMKSALWLSAKRALAPGSVVTLAPKGISASVGRGDEFAVICTRQGCSAEITDPKELPRMLRPSNPVKSKYPPTA